LVLKIFKFAGMVLPALGMLWAGPAYAQNSIGDLLSIDETTRVNGPACAFNAVGNRVLARPVNLPDNPSRLLELTRPDQARDQSPDWTKLTERHRRLASEIFDRLNSKSPVIGRDEAKRTVGPTFNQSAWVFASQSVRGSLEESCATVRNDRDQSTATAAAPPLPSKRIVIPGIVASRESRSAQMVRPSPKPSFDIPKDIWKMMQGKSWHRNLSCPAYEDLAYLAVPYWDFEGRQRTGHMIVARDVTKDVLKAFALIYKSKFRIQSMRLIHEFGGNDDQSMTANNTSAFNCRRTTSGQRLSEHSYGRAIDINPVQNPYVTRRRTIPPAGRSYNSRQERTRAQRGLIQDNGPVVAAFLSIRWRWGGDWRRVKDYQHFSQSGR